MKKEPTHPVSTGVSPGKKERKEKKGKRMGGEERTVPGYLLRQRRKKGWNLAQFLPCKNTSREGKEKRRKESVFLPNHVNGRERGKKNSPIEYCCPTRGRERKREGRG